MAGPLSEAPTEPATACPTRRAQVSTAAPSLAGVQASVIAGVLPLAQELSSAGSPIVDPGAAEVGPPAAAPLPASARLPSLEQRTASAGSPIGAQGPATAGLPIVAPGPASAGSPIVAQVPASAGSPILARGQAAGSPIAAPGPASAGPPIQAQGQTSAGPPTRQLPHYPPVSHPWWWLLDGKEKTKCKVGEIFVPKRMAEFQGPWKLSFAEWIANRHFLCDGVRDVVQPVRPSWFDKLTESELAGLNVGRPYTPGRWAEFTDAEREEWRSWVTRQRIT